MDRWYRYPMQAAHTFLGLVLLHHKTAPEAWRMTRALAYRPLR